LTLQSRPRLNASDHRTGVAVVFCAMLALGA
jgi:hypothetical protein